MKNEDPEHFLKPLGQLQEVDAPPFLLTRIRARVQETQTQVGRGRVALVAGGFCLLLAFNIFALVKAEKHTRQPEATLRGFNLSTDNNLYR